MHGAPAASIRVIKPLYGFLSDSVPILGYRRRCEGAPETHANRLRPPLPFTRSYLALAGLVGSTAWLTLATIVHTAAQATVALTVTSLGVAVSDVVVDSIVVSTHSFPRAPPLSLTSLSLSLSPSLAYPLAR